MADERIGRRIYLRGDRHYYFCTVSDKTIAKAVFAQTVEDKEARTPRQ